MFRKDKLSVYLIVSFLIHAIAAIAISKIYADQPQSHRRLDIVTSVRVQYKEPEVVPKPKVIEKVQTSNVKAASNVTRKKEPKVIQQKVRQPEKSVAKQTWESALLAAKGKAGGGSSGSAGTKGTIGSPGDRPGMKPSMGIDSPMITNKTGGSGLSSDRVYGNMALPSGKSSLPGGGGNGIAGFQAGASRTGTGIGSADIPGRGGSGGTGGKGDKGPGRGLSTGSGRGSSGTGTGTGTGKGSSGQGTGEGSGPGEMGTGTGDEGTGAGAKKGSGSGPGTGGYGSTGAKSDPNLSIPSRDSKIQQELPKKKDSSEDKRSGTTEREGFKTELEKGMTGVKPDPPQKPDSRGYENALQEEINRDLHSLRKMYEDWQNLKLPDVPKSLQITISINSEGKAPKIMSIDFHNASLQSKIKDDLTKKIREWKFKSLFDGKDDPSKWPIKLTGRISWQ